MSDTSATATGPSPARMYNYLLGGPHCLQVDRAAVDRMAAADPRMFAAAREAKAFVVRAVRYLSEEAGISQFLDIGSGLPTPDSVHEVARQAVPGARVVYVDSDPVVAEHIEARDAPGVRFVLADVRRPAQILSSAAVRETLDFTQPVGLLLAAVLHFVPDDDDPFSSVDALVSPLAGGSAVVLSHWAFQPESDVVGAATDYWRSAQVKLGADRTPADILRFMRGLELVPPGLVRTSEWRPAPGAVPPGGGADLSDIEILACVGRKP
jgi:hypothetical protein